MNNESPHPLSFRLGYGLLAALTLLHIVLAIVYANITPYRTGGYLFYSRTHPRPEDYVSDIGAPDERQHANYVIHILEGKGLPVNRVMVPDPAHPGQVIRNPLASEEYEYLQPPLYYVLDAGFGKLAGVDAVGAADPEVGKRLRYLNAFFGAGTVLGVYFLGIWGVRRRDVAFLAAAIAALLPMNLALSGAISNDPLLFCICTWCMALCAKAVREGWDWEIRVPIAILVGLGLLTKQTALDLIPAVLFAFVLRKPRLGRAISSAVITIVIALPLWIRNQRLYGDPLGLKAFQAQFAGAIQAQDMMAANGVFNHWFNYVGWYTVRSFFGAFGYMDIFLSERGNAYTGPESPGGPAAPNTLYRILFFLAALAAIGFVLYLFGPRKTRNSELGTRNSSGPLPLVPVTRAVSPLDDMSMPGRGRPPESIGSAGGVEGEAVGDGGSGPSSEPTGTRFSQIPSSAFRVPSSKNPAPGSILDTQYSTLPHPAQSSEPRALPRAEKQVHLLNAVFLAVVTLLFVRYNISLFQGQARYLYPAIGPICLGLSIGALYWAKSRTRIVIGTIVALLITLNIYAFMRLPSEFAKRIDPNLTNQVGWLEHQSIVNGPNAMQSGGPPGRLE